MPTPAPKNQPASPNPNTPHENAESESPVAPTTDGLLALYDFRSPEGEIVKDRAGVGRPLHLRITNPKAVHRAEGALTVRGNTLIRSDQSATRITQAIRRTGELTIEAWIQPAQNDLKGPARIVTLSSSGSERNFTLGQDLTRYDVRCRTTKTSNNGVPSLATPPNTLAADRTHVVYTRSRSGRTSIYINGQRVVTRDVAGDLTNWAGQYRLALANELTNDRPWQGTYHLVAIYNRALTIDQVQRNFNADIQAPRTTLAKTKPSPAQRLFDTRVARLFVNHCFECHDSATKKGRLDLSRKDAAMAGGKHGEAIVPGNAKDSPLYKSIAADEMPKKREPLSADEKEIFRQWIDGGAPWSTDVIDPANFVHDHHADKEWLRRLTVQEYIQTVRYTVGVDVSDQARRLLPPDVRADGFRNTAYNLTVDFAHVDAYAELAEIITERIDVLPFAKKYSKSRKLTDDSMRGLIANMGKWILRGPLEDHEITAYRGISTTVASAGGSFEDAVSYIIQAMLQSPRFLYRVENQKGDGSRWPVADHELASRMSYIIWGAPPDPTLFKAADAGELADPAAVQAQVSRMLKDPRAVDRSAEFITEWFDLNRLNHLRPNPDRFPNWDDALAGDMRDETLAFFKEIVWNQNRPLADLFNAQFTFATPRLARHYGLSPTGSGLSRYDLSAVPHRGGLLTQAGLLTIGGDEASMVTRGLFVLHDLLRGVVKDPPPCVDTTPPPTKPGLTQRGVAEGRIADPSCGGCHAKFEPLAFGLERFDGIGAHHQKDQHGNQLREDGEILFPGTTEPVPYETSAQLMDLLSRSDRVRQAITWKLTQFALGRPLTGTDAPIVTKIHETAQAAGGTYPDLITAIIMSDLVQTTQTETAK